MSLLSSAQAAEPRLVDQGPSWTQDARNQFYVQEQGSRLMPLAWLMALRQADGTPFVANSLQRYGYLPNAANSTGLPIGFTTGDWQRTRFVGMTCAACHTRQISVGSTSYRIDGGPAIVDFQSLLRDLDADVGNTLADNAGFAAFAARVLGAPQSAQAVASLRRDVQEWYAPFHLIMGNALPTPPWGPGRLDAVGMILNRLTGLDIGTGPDHVIEKNIRRADAPVRYPFLWNAAVQDFTQWPGFAPNGSDLLALARNIGEVYGVFAVFHPQRWPLPLLSGIDFRNINSTNFNGLDNLERLIRRIGPPRWPFGFGQDHNVLVAQGAEVFKRTTAQGGCVECHGKADGIMRQLGRRTWKTPLMDVGTDSREYKALGWTADTGILAGAQIPFRTARLNSEDLSTNVLRIAVLGAILEHFDPLAVGGVNPLDKAAQLAGVFTAPNATAAPDSAAKPSFAYESRVLEGIWAAAPYLHNGSVPTLADLLNAPEQRPRSFKIGPVYDLDKVGIAESQSMFEQTLTTTGCETRDSGNSNCGHNFGTWLPQADKRALLEYLKQL